MISVRSTYALHVEHGAAPGKIAAQPNAPHVPPERKFVATSGQFLVILSYFKLLLPFLANLTVKVVLCTFITFFSSDCHRFGTELGGQLIIGNSKLFLAIFGYFWQLLPGSLQRNQTVF